MRLNFLPLVRQPLFGVFALLMMAAPAAVSAGEQAAPAVVRDLRLKLASLKTLEGNLTVWSSFAKPGGKREILQAAGVLRAQVPGRFRLDLNAVLKDPARGSPMKFTTEALLDGKTLWLGVRNHSGKTSFLSFFDFAKLEQEFPKFFRTGDVEGYFNPADELDELNLKTVKLLGRTVLFGKPCVILEGTLKRSLSVLALEAGAGKSSRHARLRVWVGRQDGIGYQAVLLNRRGKPAGIIKLTRVRINRTLDPALFIFKAPPEATPVDMTPVLEEELNGKTQTLRR